MKKGLSCAICRLAMAAVSITVLLGAVVACGDSGGDVAGTPPPPPQGDYLYVVSTNTQGDTAPGAVYQLEIGTDGSAALLSPASVSTGLMPLAVVADPSGTHVYVANAGDGTVSQYAVGEGGALQPLSPATVTTGLPAELTEPDFWPSVHNPAYWLSVSPNGRMLYLVIVPTTVLVPLTGAAPLPSNATAPVPMIVQYAIQADGALTPLTPLAPSAMPAGPLAVDPAGHYAYLPEFKALEQFSIGSDGTLESVAVLATPVFPQGVAFAPGTGNALTLGTYVDSSNNTHGALVPVTFAANGTFTQVQSAVDLGVNATPASVAFGQSGTSAYVLTDVYGVSSVAATLAAFPYMTDGTLCTNCAPIGFNLPAGNAVTTIANGAALYTLLENGTNFPVTPSGGTVTYSATATPGNTLEPASPPVTTSIPAGFPTGMTLVVRH
jgi:hypothetical protein